MRALYVAAVLAVSSAFAQPASPDEEQRLKALSAELRCLVCQNQSLADSNAELAVDLRNQVQEHIRAGKTDQQIKDYLVQRYGDFVLYRPPVKSTTLALWIGPFVLLAVATAAMWMYLRSRRRMTGDLPVPSAARDKARRLLSEGEAASEAESKEPGS